MDKVILEFDELFDELKSRTELRSRSLEGDWEQTIVTDSEKDIVQVFFRDAADDVSNRLFGYFTLQDFEDTAILSVEVTLDKGTIKKDGIRYLRRLIIDKMMYEWYSSIGRGELGQAALSSYEVGLRKLKNLIVQPGFVEPKSRPYF